MVGRARRGRVRGAMPMGWRGAWLGPIYGWEVIHWSALDVSMCVRVWRCGTNVLPKRIEVPTGRGARVKFAP